MPLSCTVKLESVGMLHSLSRRLGYHAEVPNGCVARQLDCEHGVLIGIDVHLPSPRSSRARALRSGLLVTRRRPSTPQQRSAGSC
jgi:hypothetical protein